MAQVCPVLLAAEAEECFINVEMYRMRQEVQLGCAFGISLHIYASQQ